MGQNLQSTGNSSGGLYSLWEQALARQAIGKWCKPFEEGRMELQKEAGKGRPSTSTTADHIVRVDELIHMNRWIKINEIVAEFGLSYGSVHSIIIIHKHLNFIKVCALWVLRSLTDAHRNQLLRSSFDFTPRANQLP